MRLGWKVFIGLAAVLGVALIVVSSQTESADDPAGLGPVSPEEALPPGHPPVGAPSEGGEPTGPLTTGVVEQVVPAGGYVYLEVSDGSSDGTIWLATRPVSVEEGQTVGWADAMAMRDFYSQSLDRTFDAILFVDRIQIQTEDGGP